MSALLSLNSYHYRRGGSDVVYIEHEAMFKALGWQTAHMSMHHPKNMHSEWSEYFVDEIEFGGDYSFAQKLAMAGKVIYSFEARRKLESLLKIFPATIAHAHCIYHHISPSVLSLLQERSIPVVLTAHDLKIACPAYKMLNKSGVCEKCKNGNISQVVTNKCIRESVSVSALVAVESLVSRALGLYKKNLTRIVAPSLFYKNKLEEWGWPSQKIVHIPNYVRSEEYIPCFRPGDYFLYFGRLSLEKGVSTLIRAAVSSGTKLKIVGTGPIEGELKGLARGSNVEFLGFKSGTELWNIVRDARAVVLPSEWYENAPMSVLEAYALGKPVIGANIGGIPEMLEDDETGWSFESGNSDDLSRVMRQVSGLSPRSIEEIGGACRKLVEEEFSAHRYSASMQSLYSEIGA
jgi:glycosyltransferase involved in cell wall biosynthesis